MQKNEKSVVLIATLALGFTQVCFGIRVFDVNKSPLVGEQPDYQYKQPQGDLIVPQYFGDGPPKAVNNDMMQRSNVSPVSPPNNQISVGCKSNDKARQSSEQITQNKANLEMALNNAVKDNTPSPSGCQQGSSPSGGPTSNSQNEVHYKMQEDLPETPTLITGTNDGIFTIHPEVLDDAGTQSSGSPIIGVQWNTGAAYSQSSKRPNRIYQAANTSSTRNRKSYVQQNASLASSRTTSVPEFGHGMGKASKKSVRDDAGTNKLRGSKLATSISVSDTPIDENYNRSYSSMSDVETSLSGLDRLSDQTNANSRSAIDDNIAGSRGSHHEDTSSSDDFDKLPSNDDLHESESTSTASTPHDDHSAQDNDQSVETPDSSYDEDSRPASTDKSEPSSFDPIERASHSNEANGQNQEMPDELHVEDVGTSSGQDQKGNGFNTEDAPESDDDSQAKIESIPKHEKPDSKLNKRKTKTDKGLGGKDSPSQGSIPLQNNDNSVPRVEGLPHSGDNAVGQHEQPDAAGPLGGSASASEFPITEEPQNALQQSASTHDNLEAGSSLGTQPGGAGKNPRLENDFVSPTMLETALAQSPNIGSSSHITSGDNSNPIVGYGSTGMTLGTNPKVNERSPLSPDSEYTTQATYVGARGEVAVNESDNPSTNVDAKASIHQGTSGSNAGPLTYQSMAPSNDVLEHSLNRIGVKQGVNGAIDVSRAERVVTDDLKQESVKQLAFNAFK